MLRRMAPLAVAVALVAVAAPAGFASAGATTTTVPGAAGVEQYVETLPSAGGGIPSGSPTTTGVSNARPAANRSSGDGGIGATGLVGIVLGAIAVTTAVAVFLRRMAASRSPRPDVEPLG